MKLGNAVVVVKNMGSWSLLLQSEGGEIAKSLISLRLVFLFLLSPFPLLFIYLFFWEPPLDVFEDYFHLGAWGPFPLVLGNESLFPHASTYTPSLWAISSDLADVEKSRGFTSRGFTHAWLWCLHIYVGCDACQISIYISIHKATVLALLAIELTEACTSPVALLVHVLAKARPLSWGSSYGCGAFLGA